MKTETLLSSKIYKTIMVPLPRGRFLVVHLYSISSMHPTPQDFRLRSNIETTNNVIYFICVLYIVAFQFNVYF